MSFFWIKALHIFFMIAWMAGIFYLPRLFVYHAQTNSHEVREQFKIMERKLWFFVTPFAVLTLIFGVVLIYMHGKDWFSASKWLHVKLTLVALVYVYHGYLFVLMRRFAQDKNTHSARFYRFLNEAPVVVLFAIVALAVLKAF
ncbi:protoporphyrinogen oxidase HemJ [Aliiglaciecola lipolytica]|uniref:Protoporphyrinogen IX oxidase n=1 Tax=Aliiglaciecola lipolytica E3 TaxID=1127673 RepID=K6YEH8_9ALTE|nr:protoporphyrinogen oxidase HemJ [Aliiglaciecola lipolytica]GAC15043.1 hypothetical protein GLIP_2417 [Aliiglaciecola lipolytica E3]